MTINFLSKLSFRLLSFWTYALRWHPASLASQLSSLSSGAQGQGEGHLVGFSYLGKPAKTVYTYAYFSIFENYLEYNRGNGVFPRSVFRLHSRLDKIPGAFSVGYKIKL